MYTMTHLAHLGLGPDLFESPPPSPQGATPELQFWVGDNLLGVCGYGKPTEK